jgi:hypothetical protein
MVQVWYSSFRSTSCKTVTTALWMSHTPPVLHGQPATTAYNVWHLVVHPRLWLNISDKERHNVQKPPHSTILTCCPWKSMHRNSLLQHAHPCAHTHTHKHKTFMVQSPTPGISPVSVPLPIWTFWKRDKSLALADRTDICTLCTKRGFKKCRKYNSTGLGSNFFDRQILTTDLR